MSLLPLFGHETLRERLRQSIARGALPASLLIEGPRGIGKQRLALWLGQLLLCSADGERPCGSCRDCRYAVDLVHPDLRWFFPRPRPETDASPEKVMEDLTDQANVRAKDHGLYSAPDGMEGYYVQTIHALLREAALRPSLARRRVFVVGDAERMVVQEGSDMAANAFLKLLEEPPPTLTLVLTSSEPGALLPTIRSRLVALRAVPLSDAEVIAFLEQDEVRARVKLDGAEAELAQLASGAPGWLLEGESRREARDAAEALLNSSLRGGAELYRAVASTKSSQARGFFSDMLDAMTVLLRDRMREAVQRGDDGKARAAIRSMEAVETAKLRANGNVNPQLLSASLARTFADSGL